MKRLISRDQFITFSQMTTRDQGGRALCVAIRATERAQRERAQRELAQGGCALCAAIRAERAVILASKSAP